MSDRPSTNVHGDKISTAAAEGRAKSKLSISSGSPSAGVTSPSWKSARNTIIASKAAVRIEREAKRNLGQKPKREVEAKLQVLTRKDHVNGLLTDFDALKAEPHEQFYIEDYDVNKLYRTQGIAQQIAKSELFTMITLGVISANAVWMGVNAELNEAETFTQAETYVQVIEHIFAVFFTFELLVRFLAFANKQDALKDGWFKFDAVLVGLMVVETWLIPAMQSEGDMPNTAVFRLVRLARLSRLMRLLRKCPELITLLKGLRAAVRAVSSTLCLLLVVMYVFAIVFRQQARGIEGLEGYFGTMSECFWTLFLHGTLLDNISRVLADIKNDSPALAAVMLAFILMANFTLLNMLIGVLCEMVCSVGEYEREKNLIKFTKDAFMEAIRDSDIDQNGRLSRSEFEDFARKSNVKKILHDLGVNLDNLLRSADLIFPSDSELTGEEEGGQVPFPVILEHILTLRSSNNALVGDIVDLQHFVKTNNDKTNEFLMQIAKMQLQVLEKLGATGQQHPVTWGPAQSQSGIPDSDKAHYSSTIIRGATKSMLQPAVSPSSMVKMQLQALEKLDAKGSDQRLPLTSCPAKPQTAISGSEKANGSSVPPQPPEEPLSVSSSPLAIHSAEADPHILKACQKVVATAAAVALPAAPAVGVPQRAEKGFKMPRAATIEVLEKKIDGIMQNMQINVQNLRVAALDQKISDIIKNSRIEAQQLIRQATGISTTQLHTEFIRTGSQPGSLNTPQKEIQCSKNGIVEASPELRSWWMNQAETEPLNMDT